MSAEHDKGEPATESVFAKLPDSRPGTRSPRRRSSADTAPAAEDPRPQAGPAPATERPPPPPRPETSAEAETAPRAPRGLEDAAWAGIAVAAEAATIGVRLANRALEALRDAGERR